MNDSIEFVATSGYAQLVLNCFSIEKSEEADNEGRCNKTACAGVLRACTRGGDELARRAERATCISSDNNSAIS